ncbi:hypothetical protein QE177_11490 [Arsenophonus sp. aPb]|uniref:hypothetical protein n=1 Tax=Arsenophonus sp. aPb TaxID=3041619 RepID=UPI002469B04F|nr:hypothetical protein [Arsenophonus sp. aPb]WGL97813.1 hypothetical protein QE177_11490 [Arsenophonus sp. aPb]
MNTTIDPILLSMEQIIKQHRQDVRKQLISQFAAHLNTLAYQILNHKMAYREAYQFLLENQRILTIRPGSCTLSDQIDLVNDIAHQLLNHQIKQATHNFIKQLCAIGNSTIASKICRCVKFMPPLPV